MTNLKKLQNKVEKQWLKVRDKADPFLFEDIQDLVELEIKLEAIDNDEL